MLSVNVQNILLKNLNFCYKDSYDHESKKFKPLKEKDVIWFRKTFNFENIINETIMCFYNIVAFPPLGQGEELFTLDEILENYQTQNWLNLFPERIALKEKYPNVIERYLQITSIEGGGSYFYDKKTDYIYDISWGEEENMIIGKFKPWFTSFYDFLEWYYSENIDLNLKSLRDENSSKYR